MQTKPDPLPPPGTGLRTLAATAAAMLGFAANSLLCRAALDSRTIDAWSFTCVRLASGALVLFALAHATRGSASVRGQGSWASALALAGYAGAFSFAYLRLPTGVGALVLFTAVQATMIGWSVHGGARPSAREWTGLGLALGGLALFKLPGASAPDPLGLASMSVAGIAWGAYSLRGRASRRPLAATADNFARSVPLVLVFVVPAWGSIHASGRGVALACASGALASGLGYTLWYIALPGLGATRAALVQLVVPVIAAVAGVLLLGETLTQRLLVCGALILVGIGIAVLRPRRSAPH